MRTRNWIALAAATALVVGATVLVVGQRERASVGRDGDQAAFPGLAARLNDIAAIEVAGAKGGFRVARAGEGWAVPEKDGYPANPDRVRKAALGLAEMRLVEPRTDNPDLYDRIGVGEPGKEGSEAVRLRLLDGAGAELAALIVGKTKTSETTGRPAEIYVRKPAEKRSWLAAARLGASGDPLEWLQRDTLRVPRGRVAEVEIRHADGETVKISRDNPKTGDFALAAVPPGREVASQYDVNAIGGALDFLAFEDVRRAAALDFAGATTARFATFDGLAVTVETVLRGDQYWARFDAAFDAARARPAGEEGGELLASEAAGKQAAEFRQRLAGWAYRLGEGRGKDLSRRMADLVRAPEKKDQKKP
jgi:hypothetical protein